MSTKRSARSGVDDAGDELETPELGHDIVVTDADGNVLNDDGSTVAPGVEFTTEQTPVVDTPDETEEFAAMRRNFEALQARNQELERSQSQLAETVNAAKSASWESDKVVLQQAMAAAQADVDRLERIHAEALAANDHVAAAKANRLMQEQIAEVGEYRTALADHGQAPPAPTVVAKPAPTAPDFDASVANVMGSFTPATRAYAEKHKDALFRRDDPKPFQKILKLHEIAVNIEGIKPDTPEYFKYLDEGMKFDSEPTTNTPRPVNQRKPSMPSAPANRGGASPGRRSVPLSQQQIDIARRMGMTPQRYAAQVDKINQGQTDPNYSGPKWADLKNGRR